MPNADWYARFGYPCILHICATMYAECSIGDLRLAPSARHLFEDVIRLNPGTFRSQTTIEPGPSAMDVDGGFGYRQTSPARSSFTCGNQTAAQEFPVSPPLSRNPIWLSY